MSSRSVNMLRTRRRDNNVKPNRREFRAGRLDRKSSRGMIYENEELRLRTININAEIERGQCDIKKLKRENELLKKEIWCLRDEYEKLDKLLKEKDIDFSSSSTTTSESESCSSCMDESEDVEKSQNLENVQKTNIKNLSRNFEALSVVPEESPENSDRTSNRTSLNGQLPHDNDVLQADQNYPTTARLPDGNVPKSFYSSERFDSSLMKSYQDESMVHPSEYYANASVRHLSNDENYGQYSSSKTVNTNAKNFYQNIVLVPKKTNYAESETLQKSGTDVLVKLDNKNFTLDHEANGGGHMHYCDSFPRYVDTFGGNSQSTFSNGGNLEELLNDIETISQDILSISNAASNDYFSTTRRCKSDINPTDKQMILENDKPFKSELNVTLMPQPMALIGLEKYRDIHRSMTTTASKSLENLSNHDLHVFHAEGDNYMTRRDFQHLGQSSNEVPNFAPIHTPPINCSLDSPNIMQHPTMTTYLSNLQDNYVSGDYFTRYNTENHQNRNTPRIIINDSSGDDRESKTQPLFKQISTDVPPNENDENSKIKINPPSISGETDLNDAETEGAQQSHKVGLRKKVSIHFRGKKEKQKKTHNPITMIKRMSPLRDKRDSKLEEIKVDKTKLGSQKTLTKDSNKITSDAEPKNQPETRKTFEKIETDRKGRRSISISPDRKKIKEERKCKKHRKEKLKLRRETVTSLESRENRARSHSVTTERSNTYGGSHFFSDDDVLNSERDSVSSSETMKGRQINFSNIPVSGKVPWCGCWGNGCI